MRTFLYNEEKEVENMATDFQINLKEQRKRTGHTQQEVADACGIRNGGH